MLAARCVQLMSCWLQINISLAGTSKMLFNTEKLSGMPRKIKELAKREAQVSLHQQVWQHFLARKPTFRGDNPRSSSHTRLGFAFLEGSHGV